MLSRLEDEGAKLERGTWNFLRDEVTFGTESAVRDYSLAILRPSTVAVASILNAVEEVGDHDYETLTAALMETLKEFNFDSSQELLQARDRLHRLVNDEEVSEDAMSQPASIYPSHVSVGSSDAGGLCVTAY